MKKILKVDDKRLKRIIRENLNEALGVPSGIIEASEKIFMDIVAGIDKNYLGGTEEFNFKINKNYKFADYDVKSLRVFVDVFEHKNCKSPEILSMSVPFESQLQDNGYNLEVVSDFHNPEMKMQIVIPIGYEKDKLVNYLTTERKRIISDISHETKHLYDTFKKKIDSGTKRAEYKAYSQLKFGVKPLDEFIHNLYFITAVENLVRPTEVATEIKLNNISKKQFLNFLMNNDTFKRLLKIRNFSYQNLKKELMNSMDEINNFYKSTGMKSGNTDKEKIDELLRLVYVNLVNIKGESYKELLTSEFLENILGFTGEKATVFQKFINKIKNFETVDDFFRYEEENFHFVANKMIKKISKLYAMLEGENSSEKK